MADTSPVLGLIDRVALCLVFAPLLTASVVLAANPEGWATSPGPAAGLQNLAAISREPPPAAGVVDPQPAAMSAAAPLSVAVVSEVEALTPAPAAPLSVTEDAEASNALQDAPSELTPAIAHETEAGSSRERRCELDDIGAMPGALPLGPPLDASANWQDFGEALAGAAMRQTHDFVVYADSYRDIKFPLGDVSALFGVCTDVVIRAYRAIGIDLQALVHKARVGSGDASIDHRRVEVLRRFFAANAQSFEPSDLPDDYLPGDIVTYYRPQNTGSQSHIAIVTNVVGFSGRPLIVHNRGWGPQLEDALFVDRMTGHYRYQGPGETVTGAPPIKNTRLRWIRDKAARATRSQSATPFTAESEAIRAQLKRASESKAGGRPKS